MMGLRSGEVVRLPLSTIPFASVAEESISTIVRTLRRPERIQTTGCLRRQFPQRNRR